MSVLQATEVPQCESSREQIGHGRIGTFARERIGVGAKTAHGKRPLATPEVSLGLGFRVTLGFRVRLRVRVRIELALGLASQASRVYTTWCRGYNT